MGAYPVPIKAFPAGSALGFFASVREFESEIKVGRTGRCYEPLRPWNCICSLPLTKEALTPETVPLFG